MSERAQTWGLRILALALAIGLWFTISLDEREARGQKVVDAQVVFNNPLDLVIFDPGVRISIILSGPDTLISELDERQVRVRLDLSEESPGVASINLTPDDVSMPDGFQIVAITPSQVQLEVDQKQTLNLPIEPVFVGEPAAGALLGDYRVIPSQILVEGPRSRLERITALATQPIDLNGHALDFEANTSVVSPDPLIQMMQSSQIVVYVPLEVTQPETTPPGASP
ncbi:MAG: CdaR family protein [Acidobacteriota bacterium]